MLQPALTWWPETCSVCRSPAYHLMSFFLPTLMDDLWSTVTQDNSPLITLRFLARYNESWWSMTSSISLKEKRNLYTQLFLVERGNAIMVTMDWRKGTYIQNQKFKLEPGYESQADLSFTEFWLWAILNTLLWPPVRIPGIPPHSNDQRDRDLHQVTNKQHSGAG